MNSILIFENNTINELIKEVIKSYNENLSCIIDIFDLNDNKTFFRFFKHIYKGISISNGYYIDDDIYELELNYDNLCNKYPYTFDNSYYHTYEHYNLLREFLKDISLLNDFFSNYTYCNDILRKIKHYKFLDLNDNVLFLN